MGRQRAKIIGVGNYLPEKVLTNLDLEKMVETTDEWIQTRTGIKERRIAADHEAASDLAIKAAQNALKNAGIKAEQLDLIIVSTVTGDTIFPSTACLVQAAIGANCGAFDLSAACSGYPYGLTMASHLIASGEYKYILVVATEVLSRFLDWKDRSTCVLFGDGAGATVIGHSDDDTGILSTYLGADGKFGDLLKLPAGGSRIPPSVESIQKGQHTLEMSGTEVFKLAVRRMGEACDEAVKRAGLTMDDISLLIPHQANLRIINGLAKHLKTPMEKVFVNVHKYGNMSAASTLVALIEAIEEGRIKKGDNVLLVAFGAGLTWASCVIKW